MLSMVRVGVPLMVVLASCAAVAAEPPGCAAGDPLGTLFQDDAGSGTDASDVPEVPLHLPEGTFPGTLQLPVAHGPGDAADWYAMQVDADAKRVMVDLQSYKGAVSAPIVVDVFVPGSTEPVAVLDMDGGGAAFDPVVGTWSFQLRFVSGPGAQCEEGVELPADTAALGPVTKNYALYVGCDPVCVLGTS